MKQIKTKEITKWGVAKKTKNIKAKPLISIMVDKNVLNKFLVDTLEGKENLGDGAIICIGESNDIWQQMPKKLLQKYNVIEIDNDGWMLCEPRPENSVFCVEITKELLPIIDDVDTFISDNEFFLIGQWGEDLFLTPEIKCQIQRADYGDFICKSREDENDVWIVKKKIFTNTYNVIG